MPDFELNSPRLVFAPLAWLKLQYFCHAGPTEIGGFAITAAQDLLYVEDFQTVRQQASPITVHFDDAAVADYFDRCTDQRLRPSQFGRLWLHTHPGSAAQPTSPDEETFQRSFGGCDWAVMFILSRSGQVYARLTFNAGPGVQLLIPTAVDWSSWPLALRGDWAARFSAWHDEYERNIQVAPMPARSCERLPLQPWSQDLTNPLEWEDIHLDELAFVDRA